MEDKQYKVKNIWAYLQKEGIFTTEQLEERIKTMNKINIGMFTKREIGQCKIS